MDAGTAWLKAIHIGAFLVWSATLFYLPSLLAAYSTASDQDAFLRLRAMTRTVYIGIASTAAVVAIMSGSALIVVAAAYGGWLALKLTAVAAMVAFHVVCGSLVAQFRRPPACRQPLLLHSLVIVPAVLVPTIFYLVLGKPA
jgi:putative membrane protein